MTSSEDRAVDPDAEDAWAEIAERVRQVDQGVVKLVLWSEVRRTIAGQ